jgi:ketose-bisphosphate aldolase
MSLASGKDVIRTAWRGGYAIPAFNVSNMETAQAVVWAAEDRDAPVFLQISPGAIAYAGYATLTHLVLDLAGAARIPVVVHLDHARDLDVILGAVDDGYGSVMFDGSRLAPADNIARTAQVVAYADSKGVCVEGEIGRIGAREEMTLEDARVERTTPEAAADFVQQTGVDIVAPALGTLHGMPDDSVPLDIDHLRAVTAACGVPVALHGGSGLDPATLQAAIAGGIAKVNISSRVTRALARGIRDAWAADPDELDLRRFLASGRDAVREVAAIYCDLVGAAGRGGTAAGRAGAVERAAEPSWEVE